MEQTCRTCVYRKNYKCTCEELKESIVPKISLDGFDEAIEEYIIDKFDDFLCLSENLDVDDDAYDEMVEFIQGRKIGKDIVGMIKEQIQDIVSLEVNLDSDFVCKHWR